MQKVTISLIRTGKNYLFIIPLQNFTFFVKHTSLHDQTAVLGIFHLIFHHQFLLLIGHETELPSDDALLLIQFSATQFLSRHGDAGIL